MFLKRPPGPVYPYTCSALQSFNSLTLGRSGCDFKKWKKNTICNLIVLIGIFRSSCDVALRWMSQDIYWRLVNIGSGNGLIPSGNKPLPVKMLIQIAVAIWRHHWQTTMSLPSALIIHGSFYSIAHINGICMAHSDCKQNWNKQLVLLQLYTSDG